MQVVPARNKRCLTSLTPFIWFNEPNESYEQWLSCDSYIQITTESESETPKHTFNFNSFTRWSIDRDSNDLVSSNHWNDVVRLYDHCRLPTLHKIYFIQQIYLTEFVNVTLAYWLKSWALLKTQIFVKFCLKHACFSRFRLLSPESGAVQNGLCFTNAVPIFCEWRHVESKTRINWERTQTHFARIPQKSPKDLSNVRQRFSTIIAASTKCVHVSTSPHRLP